MSAKLVAICRSNPQKNRAVDSRIGIVQLHLMFYMQHRVKTLDPGVKAELDSESEDEVLMATSIPLKEELLSSDLDSDDQADIGNDRYLAHAV